MLQTRLIVGSALALMIGGVLFFDDDLKPSYPILFVTVATVSLLSCNELLGLFPYSRRPSWWLCQGGVLFVVTVNWSRFLNAVDPSVVPWPDPWRLILGGVGAILVLA